MAGLTVGTVYLQVTPSFDGFANAIDAQAAKSGESAGSAFSTSFNQRVKSRHRRDRRRPERCGRRFEGVVGRRQVRRHVQGQGRGGPPVAARYQHRRRLVRGRPQDCRHPARTGEPQQPERRGGHQLRPMPWPSWLPSRRPCSRLGVRRRTSTSGSTPPRPSANSVPSRSPPTPRVDWVAAAVCLAASSRPSGASAPCSRLSGCSPQPLSPSPAWPAGALAVLPHHPRRHRLGRRSSSHGVRWRVRHRQERSYAGVRRFENQGATGVRPGVLRHRQEPRRGVPGYVAVHPPGRQGHGRPG